MIEWVAIINIDSKAILSPPIAIARPMFQLCILALFIQIQSIRSLSCFKCMTTSFHNDTCRDPFNPIDNRYEIECQATVKGKNGLFPARFCAKISGVIVDIDSHLNRSLLHRHLFLRTCITENIMESTRSPDSTGNFYLKNFANIPGGVRMQGTIALCTLDGCNRSSIFTVTSLFPLIISFVLDSFRWRINSLVR